MSAAPKSALVRAAVPLFALWTLGCLIFAGWNIARNPMTARANSLYARLGAIHYVDEELPEPDKAPLSLQRNTIVKKTALWKALVEAPPPPEKKPDLAALLAGVVATRQQVTKGDVISIKMRIGPQDQRGGWFAVGDTVKGLKIKEIRPDSVIFSTTQNGKEFTTELPRN